MLAFCVKEASSIRSEAQSLPYSSTKESTKLDSNKSLVKNKSIKTKKTTETKVSRSDDRTTYSKNDIQENVKINNDTATPRKNFQTNNHTKRVKYKRKTVQANKKEVTRSSITRGQSYHSSTHFFEVPLSNNSLLTHCSVSNNLQSSIAFPLQNLQPHRYSRLRPDFKNSPACTSLPNGKWAPVASQNKGSKSTSFIVTKPENDLPFDSLPVDVIQLIFERLMSYPFALGLSTQNILLAQPLFMCSKRLHSIFFKSIQHVILSPGHHARDQTVIPLIQRCEKNLHHISLSPLRWTVRGKANVLSSRCRNLRAVSLVASEMLTDRIFFEIAAHLTQLKTLNVRNCKNITDHGVKVLCQGTCRGSITELVFARCAALSDESVKSVSNLPSLQAIDFSRCPRITDHGTSYLKKCTDLRSINLAWCGQITDATIKALRNCTKLSKIHLSMCMKISDSAIVSLAKFAHQLEVLDLYACHNITDSAALALSKCQNIKVLILSWCSKITDKAAAYLANARLLHTLDVSKCEKITNGGLLALSNSNSLKTLSFSGCWQITDEGIAALLGLTDLTGNTSPDQTAEDYSISPLVSLRDTDLSRNSQDKVRSSKLENLNISGCWKITNEAVKNLANSSDLRSLDLSYCDNLTDEAALSLVRWNRKLEIVDTSGCCQISSSANQVLEELQFAIPQMHKHLIPSFFTD